MLDNEDYENPNKAPTLAEVYPGYTGEELAEAETTLRRYVELVWRIYQRLKSEKAKKFDEK